MRTRKTRITITYDGVSVAKDVEKIITIRTEEISPRSN